MCILVVRDMLRQSKLWKAAQLRPCQAMKMLGGWPKRVGGHRRPFTLYSDFGQGDT